jgi:hypothetical protein
MNWRQNLRIIADLKIRGATGRVRRHIVAILCTLLSARAFEPSAVDQKPAGDNAHTVVARPRRANSRATNAPIELAARCGRWRPCSSR